MAKTKIGKEIETAANTLKEIMRDSLSTISELMIAQIMKNYRNSTNATRLNATKDLTQSGIPVYKDTLLKASAVVASLALENARKEVPKKSKVKLEEFDDDRLCLGEFEKLPKKVQKKLKNQINLLVQTQKADLDKVVLFQFSSSVDSTDSEKVLEYDLFESADKYINGNSVDAGAGVLAARTVNETRQAFFTDEEVLSEIDAFVFTNDDPVSPICEDLNGTIFTNDDPGADRYYPPLHYNAVLEGQIITTIDNDVLVENIKLGDLVKTHSGKFQQITEVMSKFEDKEYYTIELENGKTIDITGEHPVLCSRGWLIVDDLKISDNIICIEDI